MVNGGFKVIVNGKVIRCYQFDADFNNNSIYFNDHNRSVEFVKNWDDFAVSTEVPQETKEE